MNIRELKEASSNRSRLEARMNELKEKREFLERCYLISLNRELKDLSDRIVREFFEFFRAYEFNCSQREGRVLAVFSTAELWCSLPEKVEDHLTNKFPIKMHVIEKSSKHKRHISINIVPSFELPKMTEYATVSDDLQVAIGKEEKLIRLFGALEPVKIGFEFLLEREEGGFLVGKSFSEILAILDQKGLF